MASLKFDPGDKVTGDFVSDQIWKTGTISSSCAREICLHHIDNKAFTAYQPQSSSSLECNRTHKFEIVTFDAGDAMKRRKSPPMFSTRADLPCQKRNWPAGITAFSSRNGRYDVPVASRTLSPASIPSLLTSIRPPPRDTAPKMASPEEMVWSPDHGTFSTDPYTTSPDPDTDAQEDAESNLEQWAEKILDLEVIRGNVPGTLPKPCQKLRNE
jgi:hypothetical protein